MSAATKNKLLPPIPPRAPSLDNLGGAKIEVPRRWESDSVLRRLRPKGMPLLYEDEGLEMGESTVHTRTCHILLYGQEFHFGREPGYRVFGNLNVHYSDKDPNAYVSPDIMVVKPYRPLPKEIASYRIGKDGPAPVQATEVLSFRTYQQGDLTNKPILYADLGIDEYLLVDVTGDLLPQKLLLLRRQVNGGWGDEQDADGGITSRFGFRIILDTDGQVSVLDARTGKKYARPADAQAAAEACERAEAQVRELEAELKRLRGAAPSAESKKSPRKRRRQQ